MDPLTPRSKTKFLLRHACIIVSKINPVYRQLLVGVSLTDTMKTNMETKKESTLNRRVGLEY